MNRLSVAQRPFVYDSVEHTIDRSRTANRTARAAHHVVDALADQALTGVGKVSGSLHIAVNHAADAVIQTADWGCSGSGASAAEANQARQCGVRDHESASVPHAG